MPAPNQGNKPVPIIKWMVPWLYSNHVITAYEADALSSRPSHKLLGEIPQLEVIDARCSN